MFFWGSTSGLPCLLSASLAGGLISQFCPGPPKPLGSPTLPCGRSTFHLSLLKAHIKVTKVSKQTNRIATIFSKLFILYEYLRFRYQFCQRLVQIYQHLKFSMTALLWIFVLQDHHTRSLLLTWPTKMSNRSQDYFSNEDSRHSNII